MGNAYHLVYFGVRDSNAIEQTLYNNTFANNTGGTSLFLDVSDGGTVNRPVLRHNLFVSAQTELELSTNINAADQPFDAKFNYWGSTDETELTLRFIRDPIKETVEYFPWLASESPNSAVPLDHPRVSCSRGRGIVAGNCKGHVRLPAGVYNVTQNVIVEEGSTLEIEPGAQLYIAPRLSLHIEGALLARGTSNNPILFTCDRAAAGGECQRWGQILFKDTAWPALFTDDGEYAYVNGSIMTHVVIEQAGVIDSNGQIPALRTLVPLYLADLMINNVAGDGLDIAPASLNAFSQGVCWV